MTTRAWLLALSGLVLTATAGAASLVVGSGGAEPEAVPPSWNLYSNTQWASFEREVAARKLDTKSLHVVTSTGALTSRQLSILQAGRCFIVARGTTLGRTICKLDRPLLVFGSPGKMHGVVGLARREVVALTATNAAGDVQGLALLEAGPFRAFGVGFRDPPTLRALDGRNRVLAVVVSQ